MDFSSVHRISRTLWDHVVGGYRSVMRVIRWCFTRESSWDHEALLQSKLTSKSKTIIFKPVKLAGQKAELQEWGWPRCGYDKTSVNRWKWRYFRPVTSQIRHFGHPNLTYIIIQIGGLHIKSSQKSVYWMSFSGSRVPKVKKWRHKHTSQLKFKKNEKRKLQICLTIAVKFRHQTLSTRRTL